MIFSYMLGNIKGRKSEFLTSLVILILVGAVVSASFFYIHNSADLLLQQKLNSSPVDAWIELYTFRTENETLRITVDEVKNYIMSNYDFISNMENLTTGYSLINITITFGEPPYEYYYYEIEYTSVALVDDSFITSPFLNIFDLDVFPNQLKENEVLINRESYLTYYYYENPESLIGKNVTFVFSTKESNVTFSCKIVGFFGVTLSAGGYYYGSSFFKPTFLLSTKLLQKLMYYNWTDYQDNVLVQFRHDLINSDNWKTYKAEFENFARALRREFQPFVSVKLLINNVFESYSFWSTSSFMSYLIYMFPVIILGLVVLKFDYELTSVKRRRELSTLKSRGLSNTTLILMSLFEVVIYSAIATVISLPVGNLSSQVFLQLYGVIPSLNIQSIIVDSYLYPIYVIFVFGVIFSINLLSLMPIVFTTLTREIVEARTYTSLGLEKIKVSGYEIATVIFYWPLMIFIIFLFPIYELFSVAALVFLFYLVYIVVKIFAIIAASAKRYVFSKLKSYVDDFSTTILSANIKHRTKVPGYSVAILALVLAFALSTTALFAMTTNYAHDMSYYYTGSDISYVIAPQYAINTTTIVNITKSIDGVSDVSVMRVFTGYIRIVKEYWISEHYLKVVAVDEHFLDVAYYESYFLKSSDIQQLLDDDSAVILSEGFRWDVIDARRMTLYIPTNETVAISFSCNVVDINSYIPRIGSEDWYYFVVIGNQRVKNISYNRSTNYVLVSIDEESDPNVVANEIANVLGENITDLRVAETYYTAIQTKVENLINYGMLSLTVFYMVILISFGQAILYMDQIERYRKEFAVLKALGITKKQFRKYFLIDIISNFLGALLLAIALATGYSLYISQSPFNLPLDLSPLFKGEIYYFTGSGRYLPVELIIPYFDWLWLSLLALAVLLSVLPPVLTYIQRLNIGQELKYEFG